MSRAFSILSAALATALLAGDGAAFAGSVSGGAQTVSVNVAASCTVTSPPDFVFATTNGQQGAPASVQHNLSVNCPFITFYNIAFVSANDADATGVNKVMTAVAGGNTDTVAYQLRNGGTAVGKQDGVNTIFGIGFGFTQTYAITAAITSFTGAGGAALRAGTYRDIVTTRVDF